MLVRRVEPWLRERAPANLGYESDVVAARLAQRVVELGYPPYAAQRAGEEQEGLTPSPADTSRCLGGLVFDPASGTVKPLRRKVLTGVLEFFAHAAHVSLHAAAALFRRQPRETRPASIVMGVAVEGICFDGSDRRFVDYCVNGPVRPLSESRWLLVQALAGRATARVDPDRVTYARFPLHALAASALGARDVARLFFDMGAIALRFLTLVLRFPLMATLGRDYAYLAVLRLLDRNRAIASIVITNSLFPVQPLWMLPSALRRFRVHLVWYSQNVIPLVLAADGLRSDVPNYRHLAVDDCWVWTHSFADYLRDLGVTTEYHVVGPIVWYLPNAAGAAMEETRGGDADIRIAVFDVTPIPDDTALRLGLVHNYYRLETMARFLTDIIKTACEIERMAGRRVRLLLKHKRGYGDNHDRRYIDLVAELSDTSKLEIIHHQTTLYELMEHVDFSIVIPYSSPAYVASHIGRSAIYFDPAGELLPTHLVARGVAYASGAEALLARSLEILQRAAPPQESHDLPPAMSHAGF